MYHEELPGSGQTAIVNIQQQLARDPQAIVDAEAVIHMRIVDQPFPAHGGARFFKIHAHHDFQLAFKLFAKREQTHDQQPIVVTFQDLVDRFARMRNGVGWRFR